MTLTGRNITVRSGLALCVASALTVGYLFFSWNRSGGEGIHDIRLTHLFAIAGAAASMVLGFLFAGTYSRLFRRSPSIPVFFMTLFFLSMTLDATKLAQIVVASGSSQHLSLILGRVSIFAHVVGVLSLFAAGLYAGGIRMQRHGTVVFVGLLIAFSLSWSLPVDTTFLPDNLVYPAGVRESFQASLIVIQVLAVLNFIQASISNRNPRMLVTALSVVLLAAGRELLFFLVDPLWIIVGIGAVIFGGVVFTGQYYRDFLVS